MMAETKSLVGQVREFPTRRVLGHVDFLRVCRLVEGTATEDMGLEELTAYVNEATGLGVTKFNVRRVLRVVGRNTKREPRKDKGTVRGTGWVTEKKLRILAKELILLKEGLGLPRGEALNTVAYGKKLVE